MNGFDTFGGDAPNVLAGGMYSAGGWDGGALASTLAGPAGFELFRLALANDNFDADAPSSMVAFAAKVAVVDSPKMFPIAEGFSNF